MRPAPDIATSVRQADSCWAYLVLLLHTPGRDQGRKKMKKKAVQTSISVEAASPGHSKMLAKCALLWHMVEELPVMVVEVQCGHTMTCLPVRMDIICQSCNNRM